MKKELCWKSYYGPANQKDIDLAEKELNFNFPEPFKKIALLHDAARVKGDPIFSLESPLPGGRNTCSLGLFLGFTSETESITFREANLNGRSPLNLHLPQGIVAFSQTGDGSFLCFDYRVDREQPKILMYHSHAGPTEDFFFQCAENFEDLLEKLYFDED